MFPRNYHCFLTLNWKIDLVDKSLKKWKQPQWPQTMNNSQNGPSPSSIDVHALPCLPGVEDGSASLLNSWSEGRLQPLLVIDHLKREWQPLMHFYRVAKHRQKVSAVNLTLTRLKQYSTKIQSVGLAFEMTTIVAFLQYLKKDNNFFRGFRPWPSRQDWPRVRVFRWWWRETRRGTGCWSGCPRWWRSWRCTLRCRTWGQAERGLCNTNEKRENLNKSFTRIYFQQSVVGKAKFISD